MDTQAKRCTYCGDVKPLTEYHLSKKGKHGRTSWCKDCRSFIDAIKYRKRREKIRAKRIAIRLQALEILGGQCSWSGCNITDWRMLQVDHISGGGVKELRKLSSHGVCLYIINNPKKALKKYQCLCANHNSLKAYLNNERRT